MEQLPDGIAEALAFERTNWVHGSVLDDPFYNCPSDKSGSPPETLLKLEKDVDVSEYLLPATTSLSRFIYQSETLNGKKVPVSAYVLWPYCPRSQSDGYAVVAWAHGTSGLDANAAPSHFKNLWQHYQCPYQLALAGYVVIGTDYAGLGVGKDASGDHITHEYLTSPSQAKDVYYSVRAAQTAFTELSKSFVVIGQSQGGGAAWSVAQLAATDPLPGYLGAIAVSPYTSLIEEESDFAEIIAPVMTPAIASAFPDFELKAMLTPEGEERVKTIHKRSAAISSGVALLSGIVTLKPDWKQNEHFRKHQELTSNGGKAINGPLLVIHGEADPALSAKVAENAVEKTIASYPKSEIQYIPLPEVTHVSALSAAQHIWMDWIADRFAGHEVKSLSHLEKLVPARPKNSRQDEQNYYLAGATQPYHAPGP